MKTVAPALAFAALLVTYPALAQQEQFTAADTDGDGFLSFEETVAVASKTTPENFKAIDLNGDGKLDYDDFEIGVEEGFLVLD